jgi:hypothetical protein
MKVEEFLARHPIFSRGEFAEFNATRVVESLRTAGALLA